jgi:hypothetical protein
MEPTSDPNNLTSWAESIKPKSTGSRSADNGKSTQLYRAIVEGIDFLSGIDTDKPKLIMVLSGEFSYTFDPDFGTSEKVISKSQKANIPIYSVGYDIGMKETYRLHTLCKDTYGLSGTFSKNQEEKATNAFVEFFNQSVERSFGKKYEVNYETRFPKDGELHGTKITASGVEANYQLKTPSPGLLDWIRENMIISIILGVLLIGIIVLIIILVRKRKKEQERKELEQQNKVSELEAQGLQAQSELEKQKEILKHKEERERIQAEKALAEEQEAARKKKEEETIELMSQSGFPRLSGTFEGQQGELVINKPIVSIGRKEDNYYMINHPTVSGQHAEIHYREGGYLIKDLNSSNGTMVNGNKIQEHELKHGDVVSFGEVTLTYLK